MQRKRKKEKNESSKIINKGNEKINFSFYCENKSETHSTKNHSLSAFKISLNEKFAPTIINYRIGDTLLLPF